MTMGTTPSAPGRTVVALGALALLVLILALDTMRAEPIDPFEMPPPVAFGSGQAPTGAHCTAG